MVGFQQGGAGSKAIFIFFIYFSFFFGLLFALLLNGDLMTATVDGFYKPPRVTTRVMMAVFFNS